MPFQLRQQDSTSLRQRGTKPKVISKINKLNYLPPIRNNT